MKSHRAAVTRLLRGEHTEYVPSQDPIWHDTLKNWGQQGMPVDSEGHVVDPIDHFDYCMAGCGLPINWMAGESETVEETEDWSITRNGNGASLKYWKNQSGTPEHIHFDMENRQIWEEKYRPALVENLEERLTGDLIERKENLNRRRDAGRWTYYGNMFIWEILRASLGDENMFISLATDPEWIHDFNRVYTNLYKACYTKAFKEIGIPDGIWIYEDLGYRDRLFCNPEMLRELIFPYYCEMVEFFHSYNLPVVLHSCGYQAPMIPLAIEAGFDGLNPMEVKAGNDIFEFADLYGDKLCFIGGLDARILESRDRSVIKKGVTELMLGMRQRNARFIYGSDHSISTLVDYQDYLYSLEVYKDLSGQ